MVDKLLWGAAGRVSLRPWLVLYGLDVAFTWSSRVPTAAQKTAAALLIWAEARERAIAELTRNMDALEVSGQTTEAQRLRTAASRLRARLLSDRKRAAVLRSAMRLDRAPTGWAVDREVA